jgi:hypothetical protein
MADTPKSRRTAARPAKPTERTPPFKIWSQRFLAELATSSNVAASAKKAGVAVSKVYETRRRNPEFFRAWEQALCEGYDHLEMELLLRLRTGEIKRAAGAKVGVRTYENAVALRQLAAHKDSVARQRAIRDNQAAAEVVAAINAKLDRLRARALMAGEDVWAVDGDDDAT